MIKNSHRFLLLFLSAFLFAVPFLYPSLCPTAWVALVPFFWLVHRSRTIGQALFLGWLMGWMTNVMGLYWLVYTIRVFGEFPYPLSALIFLIFTALEASQFAIFAVLVHRFGSGPLFLFPALFWVALEFWFPHLFPWYLASSQTHFLQLIQWADILGPYGTSFLLVWLNMILYRLVFSSYEKSRAVFLPAVICAVFVGAVLSYGQIRLSSVTAAMDAAPELNLAAIQGNIDINLKWNPTQWAKNLKTYQDLTRNSAGASLIIWPETAFEPWLSEEMQELPPELRTALPPDVSFFIFGVRSFLGRPNRKDFEAFNSAFLADGQGRVLGRYHKQILMAFGEYIPFSGILSKVPGVPPLGDGFARGNGPRTLDLSGKIRVAPLICYEDLMPQLARAFVSENRANLLVNLTNDAWYGDTVAPWQHLRLAQWRAIETRRTLVRATNTGVTTVIDPKGVQAQTLPTFSPGVLPARVRIMDGETLYVRFGDWFAWLVTGISAGVFLLGYLDKKGRRSWGVFAGGQR